MQDKGYAQVCNAFQQLLDVRFKLLALVPTISGSAIALMTKDLSEFESTPLPRTVVAVLGFLVTLGLAIYDQRNNQMYNALVRRGHKLEKELAIDGAFSQRQKRSLKLFGVFTIWHDRGLALVYGSVLGAWLFPIVAGFLWASEVEALVGNVPIYAAIAALVGCILFVIEFHRLEDMA